LTPNARRGDDDAYIYRREREKALSEHE